MKLGIVIDSSAGIIKSEADKRNWGFLPLYLNIDGKDYADGIDLIPEEYYKLINIDSEVRTSATPPGIASDILDKASKEFDYVVVYTLSMHLSSQMNNIKMLSNEYSNVYVVPSLGVGYAITRDCEQLQKLAEEGKSWDEIKEMADQYANNQYGIAAPETLKWLVKGGRIGSAAASMANLLKVVPMIAFENGKLVKYGKGRVFRKTVAKIAKDLYDKYEDNVEYIIYHSDNKDIDEYKKVIDEIIGKDIRVSYFPSVIVNHIGPGTMAIITRKK